MSIIDDWPKAEQQIIRDLITLVKPMLGAPQRHIIEQLFLGPKSTDDLGNYLASTDRKYKAMNGWTSKQITAARQHLEAFFFSPEGFSQRFRLELPHQEGERLHRLRVVKNIPPQNATAFWAAHLSNGKATRLFTGQMLIAKDELFELSGARASEGYRCELLGYREVGKLGALDPLQSKNSFCQHPERVNPQPYIALSDVRAMFHLFQYFDQWSRSFEQPAPELLHSSASTDDNFNCVVLGTPFENREIRDLELYGSESEEGCLFFDAKSRTLRKVAPNGEYRAWVRRRLRATTFETIIQASHSVVLDTICHILTSDDMIARVIGNLWASKPWEGFPLEFELDIRVRLSADESGAQSFRIAKYRDQPLWGRILDPSRFFQARGRANIPSDWQAMSQG